MMYHAQYPKGDLMPAGGTAAHAKGYAQYSSLGSALKLSDPPTTGNPLPDGAIVADLQAEGQPVRYRDDGTPPTAAIGMLIPVGGPPFQYAGDLTRLQFIEAAGGGKLNVAYYGL
jgi:hypothetical protein